MRCLTHNSYFHWEASATSFKFLLKVHIFNLWSIHTIDEAILFVIRFFLVLIPRNLSKCIPDLYRNKGVAEMDTLTRCLLFSGFQNVSIPIFDIPFLNLWILDHVMPSVWIRCHKRCGCMCDNLTFKRVSIILHVL